MDLAHMKITYFHPSLFPTKLSTAGINGDLSNQSG